ncbi:8640_t:CDS:2, partial [Gigaspora margarita]
MTSQLYGQFQWQQEKAIVKRKNVKHQTTKHKQTVYFVAQKLEVVTYTKQHGQNKAANHFDLDASMVGYW